MEKIDFLSTFFKLEMIIIDTREKGKKQLNVLKAYFRVLATQDNVREEKREKRGLNVVHRK